MKKYLGFRLPPLFDDQNENEPKTFSSIRMLLPFRQALSKASLVPGRTVMCLGHGNGLITTRNLDSFPTCGTTLRRSALVQPAKIGRTCRERTEAQHCRRLPSFPTQQVSDWSKEIHKPQNETSNLVRVGDWQPESTGQHIRTPNTRFTLHDSSYVIKQWLKDPIT